MVGFEAKVLSELIKKSRRRDRELAKIIGVSQPSATRIRNRLEKKDVISEYSALLDLTKLGYTIMAFSLIKLDYKLLKDQDTFEFRRTHFERIVK